MERNKTKRGLEIASSVLTIIIGVIEFISSMIVVSRLSSYLHYEEVKVLMVTTIILSVLCVVLIILAIALIPASVDWEGKPKNKKGIIIALLVFSALMAIFLIYGFATGALSLLAIIEFVMLLTILAFLITALCLPVTVAQETAPSVAKQGTMPSAVRQETPTNAIRQNTVTTIDSVAVSNTVNNPRQTEFLRKAKTLRTLKETYVISDEEYDVAFDKLAQEYEDIL